tara:strand:- start:1320 stop:1871 length:552 start_codon:yes stop_codon:yes gene_type:complete
MFAELAAITSAISAINNTIATFKEGKANAQQAAQLLGKFGTTAQKLDNWEKKKKLKRPLTPKEAMDLSIKRREIKNIERKIKDHLMMAGMSDVWRDAERIRKESEKEHSQYLKDIHKKRKERQRKFRERATAAFIVCSLVFIGWAGWFLYEAFQEARLDSAKQRLEQAKERQRNIRKCGRIKC